MDDEIASGDDAGAALVRSFPNETRSVTLAREAVQRLLADRHLDGLTGSAEPVVTELAANAALHTTGPFEVRVDILDQGMRIGVADTSPSLPVVPTPSQTSMTGRGLLLVRSLAARMGFDQARGGKVVWAEIRSERLPGDAGVGELIEAWADDLQDTDRPIPRRRFIELGEIPTELLLAAKSHVDSLVREFVLAAAGAEEGSTSAVPAPLAELIETVVNRFSGPRLAIKRQALDAARQGLDHVRLRLELEPGAADAGEAYLQALDEADGYCRAARLLTLETPPKHRVFRHWYVGEIVRQLRAAEAGLEPGPPQPFEDRLLDEIDAVAAAWAVADRAARLYRVSSALTVAMTPEEVAQAVLGEGVAALAASGGGLVLPGTGRLSLPGSVGYNARVVESLRRESPSAELPAAVALRTGEPVWMESREERDARFPELADMEAETVSMCAVPLRIRDRLLGALRFSFAKQRLFDEDERQFVLALASLAAQALDRAELSQERARLYQRLQRSLLPPALPAVPGLDITGVYHPFGEGIEIGGDFYDAWAVGPDEWAFVLGDVCGTGPEAAGLSASVRYTLRGITTPGPDPESLLRRLNEVLLASSEPHLERFCTVMFGLVRPAAGGFEVTLATGGHPEPLLQRGDGRITALPAGGSLLGVLPEVHILTTRVHLGPGDRLVIYTDGATEARNGRRFLGIEGLIDILSRAPDTAAGAGHWVESEVLAWSGGRMQDDMAVLVLQVLP